MVALSGNMLTDAGSNPQSRLKHLPHREQVGTPTTHIAHSNPGKLMWFTLVVHASELGVI